jgi:hypothetical protein
VAPAPSKNFDVDPPAPVSDRKASQTIFKELYVNEDEKKASHWELFDISMSNRRVEQKGRSRGRIALRLQLHKMD